LFTLSLNFLLHFLDFHGFHCFLFFFFRLDLLARLSFRRIKFMLISAEFGRTLNVAFLTIIDRQGVNSVSQRENFLNFNNFLDSIDSIDIGDFISFIKLFLALLFVSCVISIWKLQDRNGNAVLSD
jgi:hypothetical protein